jgi:hypothetical protein
MSDTAHIFEQYLAARYPGTRWVARPVKRRADVTPTTATARQILEAQRPGRNEHHPILDRNTA